MALCSPAPHQSSRGSATPRTPGAPVARPAGGPASLSAPRPPREALSRNTGPEPGPLQGPRSSQTGKPRHTTAGRGCESRHGAGRAERAPLEPGGGLGHLTTSGAVLQLLHKLDKETLCLRPPRPCLPAPGLAPPKPSLRLSHSVSATGATTVPPARQARSRALGSAGWPTLLSRPRVGNLILGQRPQQSRKRPYPNTKERGKSSGRLRGISAPKPTAAPACVSCRSSRVRTADAFLAVPLDKPLPAL